jgi:hypothetical protein
MRWRAGRRHDDICSVVLLAVDAAEAAMLPAFRHHKSIAPSGVYTFLGAPTHSNSPHPPTGLVGAAEAAMLRRNLPRRTSALADRAKATVYQPSVDRSRTVRHQ